MKARNAIAVLVLPFAITCEVLLAGMCLTSYWDCGEVPITLDLWKPVLFVLVPLSLGAAVVLYVDLLVIRSYAARLSGYRRVFLVAVVGALITTFPRVILAAVGGQGVWALMPQVEFLPFAVSGAIFALILDRILAPEGR